MTCHSFVTIFCLPAWRTKKNTTCSLSCFLGRAQGLDLKPENVFLLCTLQRQNTHCNLPKVAAIYAIKHVFNIPEPHCVCVSLARTLPLTLCLPHRLCFCWCVLKWEWSLQSCSAFPLRRRIISPPQRQG